MNQPRNKEPGGQEGNRQREKGKNCCLPSATKAESREQHDQGKGGNDGVNPEEAEAPEKQAGAYGVNEKSAIGPLSRKINRPGNKRDWHQRGEHIDVSAKSIS